MGDGIQAGGRRVEQRRGHTHGSSALFVFRGIADWVDLGSGADFSMDPIFQAEVIPGVAFVGESAFGAECCEGHGCHAG